MGSRTPAPTPRIAHSRPPRRRKPRVPAGSLRARLVVAEFDGRRWHKQEAQTFAPPAAACSPAPSRRPRTRTPAATATRLAALCDALASPQRVALLSRLMLGPASYRDLTQACARAAGPLYHHVARLRVLGLISPKARDMYTITRAGRRAFLAMLAVASLTGRRRSE